jgi:hypothetical protein
MGNLELTTMVRLLVLIIPLLVLIVALRSITRGVIAQGTDYTYLWLLFRFFFDFVTYGEFCASLIVTTTANEIAIC